VITYLLDRIVLADVLADLARADACPDCQQAPRVEVRGHNDLCVLLLHSTHCPQFADEVKAEMERHRHGFLQNLTQAGE
jgi:hypothetical protein